MPHVPILEDCGLGRVLGMHWGEKGPDGQSLHKAGRHTLFLTDTNMGGQRPARGGTSGGT